MKARINFPKTSLIVSIFSFFSQQLCNPKNQKKIQPRKQQKRGRKKGKGFCSSMLISSGRVTGQEKNRRKRFSRFCAFHFLIFVFVRCVFLVPLPVLALRSSLLPPSLSSSRCLWTRWGKNAPVPLRPTHPDRTLLHTREGGEKHNLWHQPFAAAFKKKKKSLMFCCWFSPLLLLSSSSSRGGGPATEKRGHLHGREDS